MLSRVVLSVNLFPICSVVHFLTAQVVGIVHLCCINVLLRQHHMVLNDPGSPGFYCCALCEGPAACAAQGSRVDPGAVVQGKTQRLCNNSQTMTVTVLYAVLACNPLVLSMPQKQPASVRRPPIDSMSESDNQGLPESGSADDSYKLQEFLAASKLLHLVVHVHSMVLQALRQVDATYVPWWEQSVEHCWHNTSCSHTQRPLQQQSSGGTQVNAPYCNLNHDTICSTEPHTSGQVNHT